MKCPHCQAEVADDQALKAHIASEHPEIEQDQAPTNREHRWWR